MATSFIDALLYGKRARFTDDRGRPARLLGATPIPSTGVDETARAEQIARTLTRRLITPRDWGCLGVAVGYIAIAALSLIGKSVSRADLVQILAMWAGILCLSMLLIWASARVYGSRRIAAGMLLRGHCPQCGYGVAALKPEPDGCIICPECQAAWHVPADTQKQSRPPGEGAGGSSVESGRSAG